MSLGLQHYDCTECGLSVNSLAQLQQHFTGRKHANTSKIYHKANMPSNARSDDSKSTCSTLAPKSINIAKLGHQNVLNKTKQYAMGHVLATVLPQYNSRNKVMKKYPSKKMYTEEENEHEADLFKPEFKFYKRKQPPPDMTEVIDYNNHELVELKTPVGDLNQDKIQSLGLEDSSTWKIYSLKSHPGLTIISNPFTPTGQLKWISTCLMKYPQFPNQTNLKTHGLSLEKSSWWEQVNIESGKETNVQKLLRWVTLGYHHNWDTKEYSESCRGDMPDDLVGLCSSFATVLGLDDFRAQAAIINYYHLDSTLAAHTDHSELYMDAPLFSFSFGQSAVFLIGGSSKRIKPSAILLRSGDVMVMSADTRKAYHAVPRIIKTQTQPWLTHDLKAHDLLNNDSEKYELFKSCDHCCDYQNNSHCNCFSTKTASLIKCLNTENIFKTNIELEKVLFYLDSILDYISNNRINMNVRQVLPPGSDRIQEP